MGRVCRGVCNRVVWEWRHGSPGSSLGVGGGAARNSTGRGDCHEDRGPSFSRHECRGDHHRRRSEASADQDGGRCAPAQSRAHRLLKRGTGYVHDGTHQREQCRSSVGADRRRHHE